MEEIIIKLSDNLKNELAEMEDCIREELNVKEVHFEKDLSIYFNARRIMFLCL